MLATGGITYLTVTVPEKDRADANKQLNFDCKDALDIERADSDKWEQRWFKHDCQTHGNCE